MAREVVREVRNITKLPLVIKLSPNAEDIVGMAKVCEEEGADGVSLVNTFKAMAIDIKIEDQYLKMYMLGYLDQL